MPKKEDRSGWVAVQPDESSGSSLSSPAHQKIKRAQSAYQFFQKHITPSIRAEFQTSFDLAEFGRRVRQRWNDLTHEERLVFEEQARDDAARFARESHQADIAALRRREELQRQRNEEVVSWDDERRTTRAQKRKSSKKKKKKKKKMGDVDGDDDDDEDYQEAGGGADRDDSDEYDDDSSSEEEEKKKPAAKPKQRQQSQKQIDYRNKIQREKSEKEQYIANRQSDLRKERAAQAKRRLEFLLKQSNIFSHFGRVKEDTAKYGIKGGGGGNNTATSETNRRRDAMTEQEDDQAVEEADEHEATFLTSQPTTLGFGTMRAYQLEGLNWMIRLQENGVNGILADEMGLGKTLQSISILVYMLEYQHVNGPHLIVVPKSTLSNWMNEIARWAPGLTAIRFHGDKTTREELVQTQLEPAQRDEDRQWNVCVTTYEVCNIERNTLNKFAWSYLIIDEAHRLKNEASAFSKTVRLFETRYRILLTGTPLQNSLHELWALLNFLVPDVFESSEQFDEWFNLDIEDKDEKNKLISQLHKILRPFMLRRLKADVEKSLPPKHETILFTGMSKMQKDLYRNILTRDIDAIQGSASGRSRTAILNIVMQLRKCAGHPYLFPGVEDRSLPPLGEHLVENCGKMVLLDKLLQRLSERGHRVLLFTQMTRILDLMEDYLVMRRFSYCRIDGNTSYDVREESIEQFNKPDSSKFLFLLSTRAGGLGINLQTADVVILYDSDWNPQADLQAMDRAHRIGQKKPVQVFRLVTEHTVEEKIVERAQQKLKLDAMVVQQGRLKEKDKLSRDELLAAVRFGADKIFKSKDSSITDDDIDLIMDAGKRKTQELNEKLKAAEKGDLLDFKLDGGTNVQTFEGVDYSNREKASEDGLLGIFDIGKRERKEANYNENSLYQRQLNKPKQPKRKLIRLPKKLRLPRMEEWQMYDKTTLLAIQQEEEAAFKALPEEQQKLATAKQQPKTATTSEHETATPVAEDEEKPKAETTTADASEAAEDVPPAAAAAATPFELPPLISDEKKALKEKLVAQGFSEWHKNHYQSFLRASARFGRTDFEKIAAEVGKSEQDVKEYASAFWGELGKTRISEHEYEKAIKQIERGEKKIDETKGLERALRVLVSLFDNPWEELEFSYEQKTKDKLFTPEEDRHLLCWCRKYGYGQWQAIRMAIRRNPNFRFNYFLRSLPVEQVARRCEQLMKAAEKEVEQLERRARQDAGLPTEPANPGEELPPIELPKFRIIKRRQQKEASEKAAQERQKLQANVDDLAAQIQQIQDRLKQLSEGSTIARVDHHHEPHHAPPAAPPLVASQSREEETAAAAAAAAARDDQHNSDMEVEEPRTDGAPGPGGQFMKFPDYDGSEEPVEWKKPFTQFCIRKRKDVKALLDPEDRKNKKKINAMLKERWQNLSEEDKDVWREWADWDKKRHARDLAVYEGLSAGNKSTDNLHVPKKRKSQQGQQQAIPKKQRH